MVKKWKEIDEAIKATIEVPKDLQKYQELMQEVPNFNKLDGAKKVYEKKESEYDEALEEYLSDVNSLLAQYKTNFKSISMTYMADEAYESNNIFYAVLKVSFFNFVNEEYFKVIAID